jgi:DNA end-binding protein Ku
VDQSEIVSGYEVRKGKYVEVTDEELDELRTESERALKVDSFVDPETIDPLYFDGRMYFLTPDGESAFAPYSVLLHAMQHEHRHGIGKVVFSGKEQLALVRPYECILHMAMLNFDEELRQPKDIVASALPRPDARQSKLAQTLVRNWTTDDFDFERYDDEYREKVKDLIQAKSRGKEMIAPEEEEEEPQVINLMDALKKSLEGFKSARSRSKKATRRRKSG